MFKFIVFFILFGIILTNFRQPLLLELFGDLQIFYDIMDYISIPIGLILGAASYFVDYDLLQKILYGFGYVWVTKLFLQIYLFLFSKAVE
ncbi:MAG: hypothetical protein U9Q15_04575 [Patescibacteria group bacterium]|nr:hypothetical protein [Patescibacteria group bacterium]